MKIEIYTEPKNEKRFTDLVPNTGPGRKPRGTATKGRAFAALLDLREKHPDEFKALLESQES